VTLTLSENTKGSTYYYSSNINYYTY